MTDRTRELIVILDNEHRTDDVEAIINAIRMIKCVHSVTHKVQTSGDWMAISTAKMELQKKLWEVLK